MEDVNWGRFFWLLNSHTRTYGGVLRFLCWDAMVLVFFGSGFFIFSEEVFMEEKKKGKLPTMVAIRDGALADRIRAFKKLSGISMEKQVDFAWRFWLDHQEGG